MDGFMGFSVHAFGAAKAKAVVPSPKGKGIVKKAASPKKFDKASPKKALPTTTTTYHSITPLSDA